MKMKDVPVRSKSKIVAEVEIPEYETVAEAVEHQGEGTILELINVQIKTRVMNEARAQHTPGPITKTSIKERAMELVPAEAWAEAAGDKVALQNIVAKYSQMAEEQLKAEKTEAAEVTEAQGEDDDEEDE